MPEVEDTSNVAIDAQLISRMLHERRIDVISKFGLGKEHLLNPLVRGMYEKIINYTETTGHGEAPSRDQAEGLFTIQESKFLDEIYQKETLSDEEIAKKVWEDYVYNKSTRFIKDAGPLFQTDAVEAVNFLRSKFELLNRPASNIGTDIVHNPENRLEIFNQKSNNSNYFLTTGFDKLDEKLGGGMSPGEDLIVLFARTGVGKEQPLYSKVLTPYGWRAMRDIKLKDSVITGTGDLGTVIGIFPQGVKDIYHVKLDDGTVVDAGIDHLWQVDDKFDIFQASKIVTTKQLLESPRRYRIPVPGRFDIVKDNDSFHSLFIRITSAIWSDRCRLVRHSDGEYFAGLNGRYGLELRSLVSQCEDCSCAVNESTEIVAIKWAPDSDFGRFISQFLIEIKPNEYSFKHSLFIDKIQEFSYETRKSCISYILRRWSVMKSRSKLIGAISNKKLFKKLQELIKSVGGLCIRKNNSDVKFLDDSLHICYEVVLPFNPYVKSDAEFLKFMPTSRIFHRIEKVYKKGRSKCQCIMIDHPDHTYITDGYTVTHNTWVLTKMLHNCWKSGYNVGMIEPEMSDTKVGYRFDTLNKHFSNKDLVFGRKPGNGPDDYEHYIENLPAQSNSKFIVAHPKEFAGDLTVSKIKQWCSAENIQVLGIDGISYIKDEKSLPGDNMTTALTHISADLMELSILLKIPVLIVVQSNRGGTEQGGKLALENIRDSDGIAYSASKVVGLYTKNDALHMQILKNRDYETGVCLVYDWDINTGKFSFLQEGEVESSTQTGNSGHTYSNNSQEAPQSRPSRVSTPSAYMSSDPSTVF